MRDYLTPNRMAQIKKTGNITSVGGDVEKLAPPCTVGRNVKYEATVENSMAGPQKIKNRIAV